MTSIRIRTVSAIAIAALLALTPLALPMFGATFWINVIAEILIWSLLAMSVNLLFGYVGLLSFGQALYFGFGMYGAAIGITNLGWVSGARCCWASLPRPRWPPSPVHLP